MWKGRGSSSLPECCYSGPHASASVSANERNSALFHLVSLDQELASPKTDTAIGTEGGKVRGRATEKHGGREDKKRQKISVIDSKGGGGAGERGDWLPRQRVEHKHKLSVPHTHAAAY